MVEGGSDLGSSRRIAALASFLGNFANTLLVSLQAIIIVPFVLRTVGPPAYGAWLASGDLLNWIQLLDLGLPNLLIQRVGTAYGGNDSSMVGKWFFTGAFVLGIISLALICAGLTLAPWVPGLFHLVGQDVDLVRSCFMIGCLAAGISLFNNLFIGFGRAIQTTRFINSVVVGGSLLGLLAVLCMLWQGLGLWAVAIGMLVRSLSVLFGGVWFISYKLPDELRSHFQFDITILKDYMRSIPSTSIGGISYALVSQSETAIAASMASPELALVYNLTKKAADVGKNLVDIIGFASYGGFAHLVASTHFLQIRKVYEEIRFLRLAAALAVACAFLTVNHSLVKIWVGENAFGGLLLTILFAIQLVATGESYLVNYLFRASGEVERGSWILAVEAVARMIFMVVGMKIFGLSALPMANILISVPFLFWVDHLIKRKFKLTKSDQKDIGSLASTYYLGAGLITLSALFSLKLPMVGWAAIFSIGSLITGVSIVVLYRGTHEIARRGVRSLIGILPIFRWFRV